MSQQLGTRAEIAGGSSASARSAPAELPAPTIAALWPLAGIFLAALLAYYPAYSEAYLFSDDWVFASEGSPADGFLPQGRPVLGLIFRLVPRLQDSLEPYRALRLVSVCGIAGLGCLLYGLLGWLLQERWQRLAAALLLIALPTFHVHSAFMACWSYAGAAALAGAAMFAFLRSWESRRSTRLRVSLAVATVAMQVLSLAIYQPAGMWPAAVLLAFALREATWPTAAADGASSGASNSGASHSRRGLYFGIGLLLFAVAGYFLLYKLRIAWGGTETLRRDGLTSDWLDKLRWFAADALWTSLNCWDIYHPRWLGTAMALLLGLGFVVYLRRRISELRRPTRPFESLGAAFLILRLLEPLVVVAGLLVLAYLPNLAVAESYVTFRSQIALSCAVGLLLVWSAGQIAAALGGPPRRRTWAQVAATAACLAALAAAHWNVRYGFVHPNQTELNYLADSVREGLHPEVRRLHLIPSQRPCEITGGRFDEHGLRSGDVPWAAPLMCRFALASQAADASSVEIETGPPPPPASTDARTLVIDLRELKILR